MKVLNRVCEIIIGVLLEISLIAFIYFIYKSDWIVKLWDLIFKPGLNDYIQFILVVLFVVGHIILFILMFFAVVTGWLLMLGDEKEEDLF